MKNFEYFDPKTISQATRLLQKYQGNARVLAGGTDLFLRMRHRLLMPDIIIDIKRLKALFDKTNAQVPDYPSAPTDYLFAPAKRGQKRVLMRLIGGELRYDRVPESQKHLIVK